jgi:hypothetical protein
VNPSPDKAPESKRHEPLSEQEYLDLCRQFGIAESGTEPTMEQVRRAYPQNHEFEVDGRTVRMADLEDDGD